MEYKILVAEDDRALNDGICIALRQDDVAFTSAYTLKEAKELLRKEKPDMVFLDVQFPDGSGFDFLRDLRKTSDIPVLMITANDMEIDEVTGLTLGADDYITKPFSLMALRARAENIRRRAAHLSNPVFENSGYYFDFDKLDFRVNGQEIALSSAEQKLLKLFVKHPGQTLPRGMLAGHIWVAGMEYVDENALSVTMSRLRKKLAATGTKNPIETVYGIGYVWNCGPDAPRQEPLPESKQIEREAKP